MMVLMAWSYEGGPGRYFNTPRQKAFGNARIIREEKTPLSKSYFRSVRGYLIIDSILR